MKNHCRSNPCCGDPINCNRDAVGHFADWLAIEPIPPGRDANGWIPIEHAPHGRRLLLWVANGGGRDKGCPAFGTVYVYQDERTIRAEGFHGDWNVTHFQEIKEPVK